MASKDRCPRCARIGATSGCGENPTYHIPLANGDKQGLCLSASMESFVSLRQLVLCPGLTHPLPGHREVPPKSCPGAPLEEAAYCFPWGPAGCAPLFEGSTRPLRDPLGVAFPDRDPLNLSPMMLPEAAQGKGRGQS